MFVVRRYSRIDLVSTRVEWFNPCKFTIKIDEINEEGGTSPLYVIDAADESAKLSQSAGL